MQNLVCMLLIASFIATTAVAAANDQAQFPAASQEFGFEVLAGMYRPMNAAKSYDAVYTGPGLNTGLGGFWIHPSGLGVEVRGEYFSNSGRRAYLHGGSSSYDEDIAMLSLQASARYHFLRDHQISPYLLGGLGYYQLKTKTKGISDSASSSATGAHVGGGIDFFVGTPINLGFEARYSMIPNLIGKSGMSEYYGEKDFGGLAVMANVSLVFGSHKSSKQPFDQ